MTQNGKKSVIVVSHGSKNIKTAKQFNALVASLRKREKNVRIEGAFLQFNQPDLLSAIAKLVKEGYTRIGVVPFFLMHGNHIERDLPEIILAEKKKYPKVDFMIVRPLYPDIRLDAIVEDRIREVCV